MAAKPALQELETETQIFTPHYIGRFLAENSIARIWFNSHEPSSTLRAEMSWYLDRDNPDCLVKVDSLEDLRIIDPACGTGNLLVEAFDVLYDLYMHSGYSRRKNEIPALILSKNLVGRDIDAEAASAASARLVARAHERTSHFYRYDVTPDVRAFTEEDHPDAGLLGSLLRELDTDKYHVILANPPYMGSGKMNQKLRDYARKNYPLTKADLSTMFIERGFEMLHDGGLVSMVTNDSWMSLKNFEKMRVRAIKETPLLTMAHLGRNTFPGTTVSATAFIMIKAAGQMNLDNHRITFFRLVNAEPKDRPTILKHELFKYRLQGEEAQMNFNWLPDEQKAWMRRISEQTQSAQKAHDARLKAELRELRKAEAV